MAVVVTIHVHALIYPKKKTNTQLTSFHLLYTSITTQLSHHVTSSLTHPLLTHPADGPGATLRHRGRARLVGDRPAAAEVGELRVVRGGDLGTESEEQIHVLSSEKNTMKHDMW